MIFDTLTDVKKFYKSYAHEAGFSVRVGQHKKQNEEILFKRFCCSGNGTERRSYKMLVINPEKRKTPNVMESRCGCQAHICCQALQ
jgi:hypothetical protein